MNTAKRAAVVVATAGVAVGAAAGAASADAGAQGAASNSPGVLAGNVLSIPAHIAPQVVGDSVNVIGLLNPAFGNTGSQD